jgi:N-methylhydantoinase A
VSATTRIRVGVDVGGTFTKAVAVDVTSGAVVAQAVVPTSHDADNGVAEGIVAAVVEVADAVPAGAIDVITHSTTQAVNALLEGDVDPVGVIGLGRRPDLRRTRRRTTLSGVELTPGKRLATVPAFFDVTDGLSADGIRDALRRFRDAGVGSVCVAEAFSPDDDRNETAVADLAREAGFAVCASTELSGLYGLELRTVTAALNASVLPIAAATAEFVAGGAASAGLGAPVMVMRGDGGATDLAGFRAAPVRTLYSGPAASVTGALRHARVRDGIVVEVGGTSTNVAAIRDGRPLLSYVRVATHATAVRALDVRVVGVAGGSMLRLRRGTVYGVGPRSAHIAGLGYAGFAAAADLVGATVETIAPRPGDPADHAVLRLGDGTGLAVTTTCAALALGIPRPGDHAATAPAAARAAFEVVGRHCRLDGDEVARRMLAAAGEEVCDVVWALMRQQRLRHPTIVAVGGGAGGLGRLVAAMLDLPVEIPDGAAVISSIGDALSHVRAERERTVDAVDAAIVRQLADEVADEVVASGAAPHTVEIRVEEHPERGTIRAMATGAIAGAAERGAGDGRHGRDIGRYRLVTGGTTVTLLDHEGGTVIELRGEAVAGSALAAGYERLTRYRGPVTLRPSIVHVAGGRVVELTGATAVTAATDLHDDDVDDVYLVGRPI